MKNVFKLFMLALLNFAVGAMVAGQMGYDPVKGGGIAIGMAAVKTVADARSGNLVLQDAALLTLVERKLIQKFRHEGSWLARIPRYNNWVNNNVIKLNEIGADPAVLINNTTYPIAVNGRVDNESAISLYKYDTENTKVTDDEIYALPYDKQGSVQTQHRETLEEVSVAHSLHSLAATQNTATVPVLETSGADDGNGRKRLLYKDLVRMKTAMDKLKIPATNRIAVLTPEHIADLLIEDFGLRQKYMDHQAGAIVKNYAGFDLYETVTPPLWTTAGVKKAYGASKIATDREGSVIMYTPRMAQATGTATAYLSKASENPEYRMSKFGLRIYHIALPQRALGTGAIIDKLV